MKKFLSLKFLLLACFSSWAQTNMVPNGSFETYTPCPTSLSQTVNCTGWASWTDGSSDYFNTCAITGSGVTIPANTFGYQYAAGGNAYVGGYQDASTANPYKEYVTRPITPLQVGATYEVSISVSLSNTYGKVAVDDIGVYFYDKGPTYIATINRVAVVPQIDFSGNGPYTDTQNWVRLVKTFVADSAYDNIAIGSFKDPANVVTQPVGTGGGTTSYYYFDSIVVKAYDSLYFTYNDTLKCAGDTFSVNYKVSGNNIFGTGNIFTVQLSDPSGSFAGGTTDIGTVTSKLSGTIFCTLPLTIVPGTQYRIRIVASKPKYNSRDNGKNITIGVHPQDLEVTVGTPLCIGVPINLKASSSTADVTYKWKGPDAFTATVAEPSIPSADSSHVGYYIVTASVYHCTTTDSVEVTLSSYPVIDISSNSPMCEDHAMELLATADLPDVVFTWTGPEGFTANTANATIANAKIANAGAYTVRASYFGCDVIMSTLVVIKGFALELGDNFWLCDGKTQVLGGGGAEGNYLWQDGSTDTIFTVKEKGSYSLTITHPVCGVKADTIDIAYEKCECEPFVPSGFTPNNDGHNDKVTPILDCTTLDYHFIILNRFGEMVFQSKVPGVRWDGVYKGQPAEMSTYFYLLQLTGVTGKQFQFKGDIVLIR